MYVSPWMQAALLPQKFNVCGIIVPALTVWHRYILRTSGNPYAVGGPVDRGAAVDLLFLCSLTIVQYRAVMLRPTARAWRKMLIGWRIAKLSLEQINDSIEEYLGVCLRCPGHKEYAPKPGTTAAIPVAAPAEWVLVSYASRGDPAAYDKSWDSSYVQVLCAFEAHRNADGQDTSLISERDEERIDSKLERWRKEAES